MQTFLSGDEEACCTKWIAVSISFVRPWPDRPPPCYAPQNRISCFSPSPNKFPDIRFGFGTHADPTWREPSSAIGSKLYRDNGLGLFVVVPPPRKNLSRDQSCGMSRMRTFQAEPTPTVVKRCQPYEEGVTSGVASATRVMTGNLSHWFSFEAADPSNGIRQVETLSNDIALLLCMLTWNTWAP